MQNFLSKSVEKDITFNISWQTLIDLDIQKLTDKSAIIGNKILY